MICKLIYSNKFLKINIILSYNYKIIVKNSCSNVWKILISIFKVVNLDKLLNNISIYKVIIIYKLKYSISI